MKAGRPPFIWSDEVKAEILTRLMGGEAMRDICGVERDDFLPSETTVYKHLSEDEDFAEQYAHARVVQAHREVEEIKSIADSATPENVQVARLQIDARKWRASKMAAKVYGEKLDLNHSGGVSVTLESDADKL